MKNNKLLLWSFTVALSGFLFGLDVAVISGAEQTIQKLWQLSNAMHGLAVSIALYGTVVGAAFGGYFADTFGRKRSLFWVGLLFFVSAVGCALSGDVYTFMIFRLLGGFSIGASSVISPLYISEIASPKKRGFLAGLFQFNIVFGILFAYVSNYLFQHFIHGGSDWRWMLGVVGIPSLIFTFLTTLISESPRWLLLKKDDVEGARKVLNEIDPEVAEETLQSIIKSKSEAAKATTHAFFSSKYSWPILLAFLIALFNQMSGINAIIYYAPRVFEMAGLGKSTALLSSAGIGLVNLIFTMIGLSLIDKYGRKMLMYIGSFGYIISLSLIAQAFYRDSFDGISIFIFVFIASHAIGQGAVIWVFIGEIFPNEVRASGQSFGSLCHWVFAAIIANVFPLAAGMFGGGPIFLFFTGMMVLQLIYVKFMMPETKGVALEDMQIRIGH
ncbi:MAG TPA: sugar porter family MFS transporter, partial [Cyclobacteriaceae bacterium]|jgi:sugar porter (SP) family MFS transporter|nr:sugar porter family MFS transporter [Cyclobacteriaceae bacterium]